MTIYGWSEELVSRCIECDLAEPESLASLGGSAPGLVDGILSNDEEVISTLPVDEDILVEAQIDDSSGDDDVVATAEIVTRKRHHRRYTIQEKLMILRQVHR